MSTAEFTNQNLLGLLQNASGCGILFNRTLMGGGVVAGVDEFAPSESVRFIIGGEDRFSPAPRLAGTPSVEYSEALLTALEW